MTDAEPVRCWLSLGSNIEPRRHIGLALGDLQSAFGELIISPVYESVAVDCGGDNFHNLVVGIETSLPFLLLARKLRRIEEKNGRLRGVDKFAPRTLDIDLLTYGDLVLDDPDVHLPRDEITRCAFVLLPLSEVAGDEVHPLTGSTYRELWAAFDDPSQVLWQVDEAGGNSQLSD